MHGLGDTEENWTDTLEDDFAVARELGPCHFFLPRAPTQSVACNGGDRTTSWFDMRKLPLHAKDLKPRHGCSLEQALASCGRVHAAIDRLVAAGIAPAQIVVGGFSQGGAMALLATLTYPRPLRGVIVLSGVVIFGDVIGDLVPPHCRGLKVFWGHGSQDNILDISLQAEGVELLAGAGLDVTAKAYATTHSSTPDEMKDACGFFNAL